MNHSDERKTCCGAGSGAPGKYRDPVCGMVTTDPDAYIRFEHQGKTYYFCSTHCLEK